MLQKSNYVKGHCFFFQKHIAPRENSLYSRKKKWDMKKNSKKVKYLIKPGIQYFELIF